MVKKTDEEPSHLMRTIANLGNLKELGFWDRSGRSWEIDQRPGKIWEMKFSWKIALVDLHYLDKVSVYCLGGIADHGFHKTSKLSHSLRLPFACISCLWVLLNKLVSLCILVESSLCVCVCVASVFKFVSSSSVHVCYVVHVVLLRAATYSPASGHQQQYSWSCPWVVRPAPLSLRRCLQLRSIPGLRCLTEMWVVCKQPHHCC